MMIEELRTELEIDSSAIRRPHHLAHQIEKCRLAIRREAHDLVLIAIFGKSEVLSERGVRESQRIRKSNCAKGFDAIAAANTPHRAGEVAKTIDREQGSLVEW